MLMDILLLGKNGQLGSEFFRRLEGSAGTVALNRSSHGNLNKPQQLAEYVLENKPRIIINAAAYTAVDKAEDEAELAFQINSYAPAAIALAARDVGALLVHFSTDYVYDGSGHLPWHETDQTAPLNVYGQSKLAGDEAIQKSGCRHYIFRTSWVFSVTGQNFLKTILRLSREKDQLRVVNDQIGAPTSVELIASMSLRAISEAYQQNQASGVYHLVAAGETSWHEYACYIVEVARELGADVKAREVIPVPSSAFPTRARRPFNSRLDLTKISTAFDLTIPHWKCDVKKAIIEILRSNI